MNQLSLFAAEVTPPSVSDLAGLLAAQGQAVLVVPRRCRVSVVVASKLRSDWIARDIAGAGVAAERSVSHDGGFLVRTEASAELVPLLAAWTRGAVKAVPEHWTPSPRELRLWAMAAGLGVRGDYQFGVDPHAPDTHYPLAGALARVGLAPMLIGPRAGGPALRITGRRRIQRLADLVGAAPTPATDPAGPADRAVAEAAQCWPRL